MISHGNSARPPILFFNQATKQRDEGDNITGEEIKRSIKTFCLFVAEKESDRANIESSRRSGIFEIRRVGPSNHTNELCLIPVKHGLVIIWRGDEGEKNYRSCCERKGQDGMGLCIVWQGMKLIDAPLPFQTSKATSLALFLFEETH